MKKNNNSLSVVVPVYNEEESLGILTKRLKKVLRNNFSDWEIIYVTNGCTDNSYEICRQLVKAKRVKHKDLRKASKSLALDLGFKLAKKRFVATLDADLQDRPEELPKLLRKMTRERLDCVIGWRKKRHDNFSKRALSLLFNLLNRQASGINLHDFNSGLKIFKKKALENVNLYGEMHRFLPLIIDNFGFKVGEIAVKHSPRKFGQSKYDSSRFFKGFFDFLTVLFINKYVESPLHFFGLIGMILASLGLIINAYLTILWFQGEPIGHRPLLMLGILLMLLGVQFFSIGLIGELLVNIITRKKDA